MKTLAALLATSLFLAPALRAQDPAPAAASPEPTTSAATGRALDLMPTQPEPLLPPPSTPEPTLIPENPTPTQKPRGRALEEAPPKSKEKKNTTEAAENALQERVRYRQAKTRALRDPAVLAEWERAEAARTDLEKREALKRYYKTLYARMSKLDGSLKKEIAVRENVSLRRLEQRRLDGETGRLDFGDERHRNLDLE